MELSYTRVGDYEIPDLALRATYCIGHCGCLLRAYLKVYHPVVYSTLVLSERLYPHLLEVEQMAHNRINELTEQMKHERKIDETLKAADPLRWVGEMNNIRACAEEIVLREIVYA